MRLFLALAFLGLVAGSGTSALAQTWTPAQQELWQLENQQWKMEAAKDPSWIESMVHPNLSYWGNDVPGPQTKASLKLWYKYNYASSTVLEQELFPISMTITGNVAVAQYRYRVASENLKKDREVTNGHYTDVFIKEGGKWMFISWAGGDDPKK